METRNASRFAVVYVPELLQYVVERGELRVQPTTSELDPDGSRRAGRLCDALNRVYEANGTDVAER